MPQVSPKRSPKRSPEIFGHRQSAGARHPRPDSGPRGGLHPVDVNPLGIHVEVADRPVAGGPHVLDPAFAQRLSQRFGIFWDGRPVRGRAGLDLHVELHRVGPRPPAHRLHGAGFGCGQNRGAFG